MKKRAKGPLKAKTAKPRVHKTLKSAAKAIKRKGGGAVPPSAEVKKRVDERKAAVRYLVEAQAAGIAIEHPKGFPPRPANTRWPNEIKLGKRHRKEMKNLPSLARSIDGRGELLHALPITPEDVLIAGERRLNAWPLTKFKDRPIPVRVLTIDSIIAGEWDENAEREPFTPSEAVAIKQEIEKQLSKLAAQRKRAGVKADGPEKGRAADKASRAAGFDRRTIEKAEAVVEAAAAEPEKYGKLQEQMDKTGRVHGPFKRLRVLKQTQALRDAPPTLPGQGPYETVLIDFPVPAEGEKSQAEIDAAGRSFRGYPEMSIEACCAFARDKIMPILAPNCSAWLTFPNFHIVRGYAYQITSAFDGFAGVTMVTWEKDRLGRGQVVRDKTEHAILIQRGKPLVDVYGEDPPTTWLKGARRENSRKPDELYALIERVTPAARYAEIFSRGGRGATWDCHGDEVGKFEAPAAEKDKGDGETVAGSIYQVELGFKKPDSYRRTPAKQKLVPEIVKPGDIVTTSYHTGPDRVLKVEGPLFYKPKRGEKYPHYTLTLCDLDAKTKKASGTINEVVAVDGRLVMLFGSNDDEIFIQPEERYRTPLSAAEQIEWKAILAARNTAGDKEGFSPIDPLMSDLAGKGLVEHSEDPGYWALTSEGWMRFRELELRLAATETAALAEPGRDGPPLVEQLVALETIARCAWPDITGMRDYCEQKGWLAKSGERADGKRRYRAKAKLTKAGEERLRALRDWRSRRVEASPALPQDPEQLEWQLLCDVQAGKPIPAGDEGALEGRELIQRRSTGTGFFLTPLGERRLHKLDKTFATDAIELAGAAEPGLFEATAAATSQNPASRDAENRDTPTTPDKREVKSGEAEDDQLGIPEFLLRAPPPPRTTSLVNPRALPSESEVKRIADRAEATE